MEKYSSVFLQNRALPCYALLGVPAYLTKFPKLVWTIAYSIRKESCKNFQPFSCYNFKSKNGRCPVTPLRVTHIAENNSENFIHHKLLDAKGF